MAVILEKIEPSIGDDQDVRLVRHCCRETMKLQDLPVDRMMDMNGWGEENFHPSIDE